LAKIAFLEGYFDTAIDYLEQSQSLLNKLKDKFRIKNNFRLYSDIFEAKNMIDSAFHYQKKYAVMKDSIFNEELANNLTNVQISAATYQQEQTISSQKETISRGKLLAVFLSSILALSIALIVVIFRNYINTNKINKQLNESKNEIEAQKENLEKKNEQLADAQVTIQNQNEVLKNINSDLDRKVKDRTKELDKSNHELEKAVKDLDQFIYKTSHDLRGPIATMQGIINLGVMDAVEDRSKEYFHTLHKVSNNLNNVLFRLIEVHETYQKKPELEKLDPMREIIETTNRVSQFSIDPDLTVVTELQASGKWNSDKVLFNLIIENMLRSAILYKDRGDSSIKIKTQYKNNHLNIIFEDNGFGIHPGDESKVFNIFFKGSPRPGGTGLEIYTAKIAVEKLGGTINLVKPLKNTIFEINLPILDN
jgi:signal transduction histidine kinase